MVKAFGGWLGRDLRFAWRMALKHPVFSITIILSLTLGIGANTAIFSLLHATLLRSLPVEHPEELVILSDPGSAGRFNGTEEGSRSLFSFPEFEYLKESCDAFSGLMASQSSSEAVQLRYEGTASDGESVRMRLVSGNYFSVLGVRPLLGRTFSQDSPRERWAVLSYPYWQRRFGLDPAVVDKTFVLGDASFSIAGVMGPGFFGETVGATPDMWLPLQTQPIVLPGRDYLHVRPNPVEKVMFLHLFGRLRPGVEMKTASGQVNLLFKQLLESEAGPGLSAEQREEFLDQNIVIRPGGRGASSFRSSFSQPLFILMGGVGLILLLACSNVATLLLVRATVRERELGIRLAIGASRSQIVRQMLTESVFLSAAGGALGILFSVWASNALLRMVLTGPTALAPNWRPDLAVMAFTVLVSVLTGVLFGLAPAYRGLRADVHSALQLGRVCGRAGHHRLGKALVAVQVALSLLLLIGAGLFLSTLSNLGQQVLGYDRDNLALVWVDSRPAGYEGDRSRLLFRQIQERLRALPSVAAASFSVNGILAGTDSGDALWVEGYSAPGGESPGANYDHVGPDYFEVMGIPLLAGRGISAQDDSNAPYVTVINETMAHFFFGETDPIGKRIRIEYGGETFPEYTIVGVSKDVKTGSLRSDAGRRFYLPAFQPSYPLQTFYFIVRGRGHSAVAAAALREAILGIDPNLRVGSVRQIEDLIDSRLEQERLIARLSAVFGGVALLLAAVGLYGLMSYSIARRTNEIGIRMAMGAMRRNVVSMVLRETVILALIGMAVGWPLALAGSRLVSGFLFGISGQDPGITVLAAALLMATVLAAGLIPALRAARISPLVAVRSE